MASCVVAALFVATRICGSGKTCDPLPVAVMPGSTSIEDERPGTHKLYGTRRGPRIQRESGEFDYKQCLRGEVVFVAVAHPFSPKARQAHQQ